MLFAAIFLSGLCLTSCKNKPAEATKKIKQDTTTFYPLQAYFLQQLRNVDDTNLIYKLEINNGKQDSVRISKAAFDSLSSQFTTAINEEFNNANYKESVFHDESTNSNTINYTANNKNLPVQNINILLDPIDQQVKRVFFSKYTQAKDSSMMQNFGWKNDNSFYINSSIALKDKAQKEKQLIVVWGKEM